MKMKTKENRKSRSDDKTRFGETNKFEGRCAEIERKIKYEAEIAATTQNQEMTESLKIPKEAEGVVDPGVTGTKTQPLQLQWRRY